MVIGDSGIIGGFVCSALSGQAEIAVTANPANGSAAAQRLKRQDIDVVIMDSGMKESNGVDALPDLFAVDPEAKIIIASTLSFTNAKAAMKGLLAGAAEFIALPSPSRRLRKTAISAPMKRDFLNKITSLGRERRKAGGGGGKAAPAITLRRPALQLPEIIVIGSSTGGPRALLSIFKRLPTNIKQPILISQHLPPAFTATLVKNITKNSRWAGDEAKNGEEIKPGRIYLAPGNRHMLVKVRGEKKHIQLTDGLPVNFCKPSVDTLFLSVAEAYGGRALALMLTGMGSDGLKGSQAIADAGGTVIAQDEDSCIVWGMPRAVAEAGLCSAVLPLKDIPRHLRKAATGAKE